MAYVQKSAPDHETYLLKKTDKKVSKNHRVVCCPQKSLLLTFRAKIIYTYLKLELPDLALNTFQLKFNAIFTLKILKFQKFSIFIYYMFIRLLQPFIWLTYVMMTLITLCDYLSNHAINYCVSHTFPHANRFHRMHLIEQSFLYY